MFNPACLTLLMPGQHLPSGEAWPFGWKHGHSGDWSQWPVVERSFLPRSFQLPDTRLQTRPVLVIASGNAHKVAEIGAMLDAVDLEVLPQPEGVEVEEEI